MRRRRNILGKILSESMYSSGSPDAQKVIDAIRNRNYVRIRYNDGQEPVGSARNSRLIMPFAFGVTKAGNPVLRAYQVNGGTRRGMPKWKFFRLDRIENWATMTNKHFNQTPDELGFTGAEAFNRYGDKSMSGVIAMVDFSDIDKMSPLERLKVYGQERINGPAITTRGMDVSPNMRQRKRTTVKGMSRADIERNIADTERERGETAFDVWDLASQEAAMNDGAISTDMVSSLGKSGTKDRSIGGHEFDDHVNDTSEYEKFFNGEEIPDEELDNGERTSLFGNDIDFDDYSEDMVPDDGGVGTEPIPGDEDEDKFK
jgi:hypothetical protein